MVGALHFICILKPHALIAMHCISIQQFPCFICLLNSVKFWKSTRANTHTHTIQNCDPWHSFENLISPHIVHKRCKNTMTFTKRTRHKHTISTSTYNTLAREITNSIKFRNIYTLTLSFSVLFSHFSRANRDSILSVYLC